MTTHYSDILTHTRQYFSFEDLDSNTIEIEDIAQGLSNTCRFAGQCPEFYSVAQHSVLVYWMLSNNLNVTDPATLMQGLLHDATEAYIGDMTSPLKRIMPEYRALEQRLNDKIMRHFGISPVMAPAVKKADLMALAIEKRELFGNADAWDVLVDIPETRWTLTPISPPVARALFKRTFTYVDRMLKATL